MRGSPSVAITVSALCLCNVIVGFLLGYGTAGAYVAFWTLAGLLTIAARRVALAGAGDRGTADRQIRTGVAAFAIVVLCTGLLGAAGRLHLAYLLVAQVVCFAVSFALPNRALRPAGLLLPELPASVVAIAGALLAFGMAYAVTHAPLTLYDSVSYHLFFSARWLQDHGLSIIPTPFSDEAQAYTPANGELFFLWLMLPFHGDLLARAGQLPFALVAASTLYALARRAGAAPRHAVYPAAFFLLSRPVLEQTIGANVDLVCASMFFASLYLAILAADEDRRADWIFWGIAVGLFAGSKYLALVYLPVLLFAAVAGRLRPGIAWGLPGAAIFALPWYVRNWVAAGSPIYPATLSVDGITVARGAFTRAAMLNTVFHTSDPALLPVIAARALGPTLLIVWLPFALIGAANMVRRGWWPTGVLAVVPVMMVPLYWFGLPVNIDARFLMPALGPALIPLAFAFRRSSSWNTAVHIAYALGMIWIVVGMRLEIPATLPWFMGGWLALDGLVTSRFLPLFALVTAIVGATWRMTATRFPRVAVPLTMAICAASAVTLAAAGQRWCGAAGCDYLNTTSPHINGDLLVGWRWIGQNVGRGTIAYTGINLPYPLTGPHLTNRVVYANIDGHPRWRFHDYDRAYRAGRFAPSTPALAASSGELRPVVARTGPRDDAVRPRYERMAGSRAAWIGNLAVLRVTHLFVAALSLYEIDNVWHNADGFPIEDDWAAAEPHLFRLVYENPKVRIYAVNLPAKESA